METFSAFEWLVVRGRHWWLEPSQWVSHAEFWPFIRSCLCSETPWRSCGGTVIETFIHSQYNPGCTINKAIQNKKCKQKSNSFDFKKRYLDRMSTKSTEFLHHMTPQACTQDPRFFSRKLLSKCFEIKPQPMMAAATGLLQLDTKPGARAAIVCSTMREVTKPLITKKITDYRPSVPGPTYLEHCLF